MSENDFSQQSSPETQKPGKKYLFYRILGFINNFAAVFFLFITLMAFAAAGFQPGLLLFLFVALAILIYTNLTNVFARHVMIRGNDLRKRLKDWIKANAIVALIFAAYLIIKIIQLLTDSSIVQQLMDFYSENMEGITKEMIQRTLTIGMSILGVYLLILIIHIILSFRYISQFQEHFKNQGGGSPQ